MGGNVLLLRIAHFCFFQKCEKRFRFTLDCSFPAAQNLWSQTISPLIFFASAELQSSKTLKDRLCFSLARMWVNQWLAVPAVCTQEVRYGACQDHHRFSYTFQMTPPGHREHALHARVLPHVPSFLSFLKPLFCINLEATIKYQSTENEL